VLKYFAAAVMMIVSFGASAEQATWTVSRASGQVFVGTESAQRISLKAGQDVPLGGMVSTGFSGRVLLMRGQATITLGPNTVLRLPRDVGGKTVIIEDKGRAEFEVDHRIYPHFTVKTPYLAAVVKGTRFIVDATRRQAVVSVIRGKVGVSDNRSGSKVDIVAGQSAKVSSVAGLEVGGKVLPAVKGDKDREDEQAAVDGATAKETETADGGSGGVTVGVNAGNTVTAGANVGSGGVNVGANVGGTNLSLNLGGSGNSGNANGNSGNGNGNGNNGNGNGNGGSSGSGGSGGGLVGSVVGTVGGIVGGLL
jgi:hypothetical protein